jgi:hypothetical protein
VTIDAFCEVCGEGIVWYDAHPPERLKAGWMHARLDPPYFDHDPKPRSTA